MHGGQFIHRIASSLMTDGSTKAATEKEMRNWQLNVPEGRKKREREREREQRLWTESEWCIFMEDNARATFKNLTETTIRNVNALEIL